MSNGERTSQAPDALRRNRKIFLWVSALSAAAIILAASSVILPFILGLVVAYILTPAVLWVERKKIPRWAAILLVYAMSLGIIGGFFTFTIPTLVKEARGLSDEVPRLTREATEVWLPALDEKLGSWMTVSSGGAPAPEGEPAPDAPPAPTGEPSSATGTSTGTSTATGAEAEVAAPEIGGAPITIHPRPGGGFDVTLNDGVQLRKTGTDVWQVEPSLEHPRGISSGNVLRSAFERAVSYIGTNSIEVLRFGQAVFGAISRGIFYLFITLMLGGYMIYTHEKILSFFRELWSVETQSAFDRFLHRLDRSLAGVVRGQLLICLVNGVLSAIGFWLFDLKYWPLLAIIAAVGSLIPIFGSILSTIPAVLIALTQSFGTAVAVLAWVVGIHQLEANFLNPKIIGDAAKIHPVLVVFSLLVGEHYFGITGALFAVPTLAVLQTLFLHFRESTMGLRDPTSTLPPQARRADE